MTGYTEPTQGQRVRDLREDDLQATAALHLSGLPESFFAMLGPGFLRQYHRTFVDSPHAVGLVLEVEARPQGMLLAVLSPTQHGAYVVRRWGRRLAVRGALALLMRPRLLLLFLRTRVLRYARALLRRTRVPAPPPAPGQWSVLSHVAVEASARRGGAGRLLVHALHTRVREAGTAGIVLLTDPEGPGPAFYDRLGYEAEGEVVGADGHRWLRYRRRLT